MLACGKKPPVSWLEPAATGRPELSCWPLEANLATNLATGWRLEAAQVDALFPELGLQVGWVAHVDLRAARAERCDDQLVLLDPELRFWSRRGELLDVAVVTDALVHPRMILSLRRDALYTAPPPGSWQAPDRTVLRFVGPVRVGSVTSP